MSTSSSVRRPQILVGIALVLVLAAWQARGVWEDSGAYVFLLFGIPLVCAGCALVIERVSVSSTAPALTALLGVVSLAWSVITALGVGPGLVVPSVLLIAAAMASWSDRRQHTSVALRD